MFVPPWSTTIARSSLAAVTSPEVTQLHNSKAIVPSLLQPRAVRDCDTHRSIHQCIVRVNRSFVLCPVTDVTRTDQQGRRSRALEVQPPWKSNREENCSKMDHTVGAHHGAKSPFMLTVPREQSVMG